jgi:LPXTG-site transpeptidase (sortase) family protein
VTFSESVTVTGTPQLTLETGATDRTVNYVSGSGTNTLTFTYTVQAGDSSADLDYVAANSLGLNGGTIQDAALNNATLTLAAPAAVNSLGANKAIVIDTGAPAVSGVSSTAANGSYAVGSTIAITITFSEPVLVTGVPQLTLETGATDRVVDYASGTGTNVLTFNYVVQPGDTSTDLDYLSVNALALNGGTIQDAVLNNAVLSLPTPGSVGSLGANKGIVVDTSSPTVGATSLLASYTDTGPATFTVTFSEAVNNAGGGTGVNDATNPANYLVVNIGANQIVDTVSCKLGPAGDDAKVAVASVAYTPPTAIVTFSAPLPVGSYRLFVCGTTSIADLALNKLNGGLTDFGFNFSVVASPVAGAASATAGDPKSDAPLFKGPLPSTGFAPNIVTSLPLQPADLAYTEMGGVWLEIPSQNIKFDIVGVPQTETGWDTTWLDRNIGWLNGTAYPTWDGNSVLTGHVFDSNGKPGPFVNLKSLKYGDQIIIHMNGEMYIFEVRKTKLVRPETTGFALEHLEGGSFLTLITCQGYNEQASNYRFRRVVRAVLINVVPEK